MNRFQGPNEGSPEALKTAKAEDMDKVGSTLDTEEFISCQKCKQSIKRTSQDLLRHNEICSKGFGEKSLKDQNSSPQVQQSKPSAEKIGQRGMCCIAM